ncbi:MAG: hypothetical protein IIY70_01280 [Oscillospiraceae bacterium]|nr:hypothetical protein [Oscillospiraceae bacterium]
MEAQMTRELIVLPSDCDREAKLSVPDLFAWFMDVATLHAQSLGVGIDDMLARGQFWLAVKTKVHILRRPRMMEPVSLFTRPLAPEKIRTIREYRLEREGELLAEGKTEWAVLDTNTGKLCPMAGIFPAELELAKEPAYPVPFARLNPDFSEAEPVGQYTVRSTDIDVGGHMNNVAYLRAVFGLLSGKELEQLPCRELEIIYRSPCFEGDTLSVRRRRTEGGWELAALLPDGKPAVLLRAG